MKLLTVRGKDFGCFPQIEQDLHEQGLVYVVGRNLDTDAADSNGSGKTTIFKLISWVLFGQTVDGLRGDEVIRHGAKSAAGELDLGNGENVYTIRRTRAKGKPKLAILKDGKPLDIAKDDLQKRIEKWVGLDFKTFKNSVLYGQGDVARFASPATKDSERKDGLHRIMDTEILKTCHRLALDRKGGLEKEIQRAEHKRESATERLADIDLDDLKARAGEWEGEREERVEAHRAEAAGLLERAKAQQAAGSGVDGLERGVARLEAERDRAAEADAAAAQEIETLTTGLDTAREQWEEARRELAGVEAKGEQIAGQIVVTEKAAGDVVELSEELDQKSGEWRMLEEAVARCNTEIVSLEKQLEKRQKEVLETASNLGIAKVEIREREEELVRLEGDRCPTCNSSLDSGEAAKFVSMVRERHQTCMEKVRGLSPKCDNAKSQLDECQKTLAFVRDKVRQLRIAIEKLVEHIGGLKASLAAAKEAESLLAGLHEEFKSYQGRGEVLRLAQEEMEQSGRERKEALEVAEAKAKLRLQAERKRAIELVAIRETLAAARAAADSANELKAQVRREMRRMQEAEEATNPWGVQLGEAEGKAAECRERLARLDEELRRLGHELAHVVFWMRGFGNEGLPSFVLDSVMPYITERTNYYLGTLTDGDISMAFRTQRELKSRDGVKDEISIYWMIEGNEMVPPSGGQQRKMEIACDLALMDLVASREGLDLDLMLLDEVLDGLDREGRTRVLELLGELRRRRCSVFVVSHESDLAEEFERVAVVTKRDGCARLEMVK